MDRLAIIDRIRKRMNKVCREVSKPKRRHNTMQRNLLRLADDLGFTGIAELWIRGVKPGRDGKLDVAWYDSDNNLVVAIEIDSSPRPRSIEKLVKSGGHIPLWIYCGAESLAGIDTKGLIILQPPPDYRISKRLPKPSPKHKKLLGLTG